MKSYIIPFLLFFIIVFGLKFTAEGQNGQLIWGNLRLVQIDSVGSCSPNGAASKNLIDGKYFKCVSGSWTQMNNTDVNMYSTYLGKPPGPVLQGVNDGDILIWSAAMGVWYPTANTGGGGGGTSIPIGNLASIPGSCTVGSLYFATDATAGYNLYGCTAPNTWTAQGSPTAGTLYVNQSCTYNSGNGTWSYSRVGRNVQVWRNGILQTQGLDYSIDLPSSTITPLAITLFNGTVVSGWPSTDLVTTAYVSP